MFRCSSTSGCHSNPDDQNCTQRVLFQGFLKETKCSYESAVLFQFFVWVFVCLFFVFGLVWCLQVMEDYLKQRRKTFLFLSATQTEVGRSTATNPNTGRLLPSAPRLGQRASLALPAYLSQSCDHLSYQPAPMKALFLRFVSIGQLKVSL